MSTCPHRESATIYQFPVGGRDALRRRRDEAKPMPQPQVAMVASGSGWYHEAAIEEAERERPHAR